MSCSTNTPQITDVQNPVTVNILRGLPGAGKSTWAAMWRDKCPDRREIVNRDALRLELFGTYSRLTPAQEDQITDIELRLADLAIREGKSVVVDDTNLRPHYVRTWIRFAANHGVAHRVVIIDTALAECLRRNAARGAAGGRRVPDAIIRRMAATASW